MLKTLGLVIFMAALMASACRKEVQNPPEVSFISPPENKFYDYGDTIYINASVYHEELKAIQVTIVNADYQPVEEIQVIPFQGQSALVNTFLVIKNKRIVTGKHYIRLQVTTHNQSYNSFRAIRIGELVKQRVAIYAATTQQYQRKVFRLTPQQIKEVYRGQGDASDVCVSSYYNRLVVAPSDMGSRLVFDTENDSLIHEETNPTGFGQRFMNQLSFTGNEVMGLYTLSRLIGYQNDCVDEKFSILLNDNAEPLDMIRMGSYYIVLVSKPQITGKTILYFHTATRALLRQVDIGNNRNHIALLPVTDNRFVVLYNNAQGKAAWESFDLNGQFYAMPQLPDYSLTCAAATSNGELILGTLQGVVRFSSNPYGFLPLLPFAPSHLLYDEIRKQLIVANGSVISAYSYPSVLLAETYLLDWPVVGIDIQYNK